MPETAEPVHVAARRLRWFRAAFRGFLDHLGEELGCRFHVDEGHLAETFVAWIRAVEAQRPSDPVARKAYFEFAAGLMLRDLLRTMPVRAEGTPTRAAPDSAAAFWPEGYACTIFCLTVARVALRQEFGEEPSLAPRMLDLRTWWSFRENVRDDPTVAIAFLELFLGREPNWLMPDVFAARLRREIEAGSAPARLRG